MQIKTETLVGLFVLSAVAIFIFMSVHIGVLRFDRSTYAPYELYFTNISGLNEKADVKIAGVTVGYVDSLQLVDGQVKATICVRAVYQIHTDASATVRQDGILGTRYVDLVPGSSDLPCVAAGAMLRQNNRDPVVLDELLHHFKNIAAHIEDVTRSLRDTIGTQEGADRLRITVDSFTHAAQKIAAVADRVDGVLAQNSTELVQTIKEFKALAKELQERIPTISQKVESLAAPAQEIIQKINQGGGVLGKLVHDDAAYKDVTVVVNNLRGLFAKFNTFYCIVDGHVEALCKFHDHAGFTNGKGYLNFRIHPAPDYFCLVGVTASFKGRLNEQDEHRKWYAASGKQLNPASMQLTPADTLEFAPCTSCKTRKYNALSLNLQLGKVFRNTAVRVGLFEGSAGAALDWDIPLGADWVRWISTVELFDIRGKNRFNDDRPHLKWLNKLYFLNELYVALGADDFVSKCDKTFLFGAGVRVLF